MGQEMMIWTPPSNNLATALHGVQHYALQTLFAGGGGGY